MLLEIHLELNCSSQSTSEPAYNPIPHRSRTLTGPGIPRLESVNDDDHEIIDLSQYAGSLKLPANNWKLIRGEAADAALLVENKSKNKNVWLGWPGVVVEDEREK